MRNGILASVFALLANASLVFSQNPYGYELTQPNPSYGYYNNAPNYSAGYSTPQGYANGYPANYGMPQSYASGYPGYYAQQPGYPAPTPLGTGGQTSSGKVVAASVPARMPQAPGPEGQSEAPTSQSATLSSPASISPETQAFPIETSDEGAHVPEMIDPTTSPSDGPSEHISAPFGGHDPQGNGPRFWGSADFLLWHLKEAPLPVPLVTLGTEFVPPLMATSSAGILGVPGTMVVSPDHFSFPWSSGARVTAGGWLDPDSRFGLEGSGFFLSQQTSRFVTGQQPTTGNQALAIPFFDASINAENALQLTDPLGSPFGTQANISIQNTIRLWGAEMNGLAGVWSNDWCTIGLLAGVRYLDLDESLVMDTSVNNNALAMFPIPAGTYVNLSDRFATRNQFYGGQAGLKGELRWQAFFFDIAGKVAVGPVHESVSINGETSTNFNGLTGLISPTPITTPTGVFAQATNIGRQTQDQFAVVPELQFNVGVALASWVRLSAGYDFLYINTVLRPGDQIDRQINALNFAPGFPFPVGPPTVLTAPFRPLVPLNSTSFYAQGVNVSLEFRY